MLISISSDAAIKEMAEPAWRATRRLRGRLHHGLRQCPQSASPFRRTSADQTCDRCNELLELALLEGVRRLRKQGVDHVEADDLRARTYRLAPNWLLSARDRIAGELNMTVRPKRLATAGWFTAAVPDPTDQQIVIAVVYFVRSFDAPAADGQPFPYDRLGRDVGLSAADTRGRLLEALSRLREVKPDWVENNIILPLSRRGAEADDDLASGDTGVLDEYPGHESDELDDGDSDDGWADLG